MLHTINIKQQGIYKVSLRHPGKLRPYYSDPPASFCTFWHLWFCRILTWKQRCCGFIITTLRNAWEDRVVSYVWYKTPTDQASQWSDALDSKNRPRPTTACLEVSCKEVLAHAWGSLMVCQWWWKNVNKAESRPWNLPPDFPDSGFIRLKPAKLKLDYSKFVDEIDNLMYAPVQLGAPTNLCWELCTKTDARRQLPGCLVRGSPSHQPPIRIGSWQKNQVLTTQVMQNWVHIHPKWQNWLIFKHTCSNEHGWVCSSM